ncbi:MAG: zinc metalloprotease HtpX [Candidatus Peribacteraceae bacterium]
MAHIKTTILLATLTGLLLLLGYSVGGQQGAFTALLFSFAMNIGSYWFSDKIVLRTYRAKQVTEQDHPELVSMVKELSEKAGLPMPKVYIAPMDIPNAFATGRNPTHAAVAVTTGILRILNPNELRAVLAHELGHVQNRDILLTTIAATLAGALSYLAQMAYMMGRSSNGGNRASPIAGLALVVLSPMIATMLHMALSRTREYHADHAGAKMSGDPLALASALEKLHSSARAVPRSASPLEQATASLFIVNPFKSSVLQALFSTHPPVEERIKRLHEMAKS